MRGAAPSHAWRLLAPLLLIAATLAATLGGQQERDDETDTGAFKPTATPKHELPVHADSLDLVPTDELRSLYQPVLVDLGGDQALLAGVEYTFGQGDRLGARTWDGERLGEWEWVTPEPGRILRPAGTRNARGEAQLVWLEVGANGGQLVTSWRTADGWTAPTPVADLGPVQDVQCLAVEGEDPWITWQAWKPTDAGNQGGRLGLFLGRLHDDQVLPVADHPDSSAGPVHALPLQDGPGTDTDPSMALGPDGELWIAWSHYTGADREVFLRVMHPGLGFTSDPMNLSQDAVSDDRHPSLAVADDGTVWCAFDRMVDPRRGRSVRDLETDPPRGQEASLKVVCWRNGTRWAPKGEDEEPGILATSLLLSWGGARPQLALDQAGRPQVFYRYFDEELGLSAVHSYPLVSQVYDQGQWTRPSLFPGSEGSQSAAALLVQEHRFLLAWHQDQRHLQTLTSLDRDLPKEVQAALDARGQYLSGRTGPSSLGRTVVSRHTDAAVEAPVLQALEEAAGSARSHALGRPWEDDVLSGRTHLTVENGEQALQVYWGDLHRHSSVSRCLNGLEPPPEERFDLGRDVCLYDFLALTDHSGHMDMLDWWHERKLVDLLQTPSFTTFVGFEWSHSTYGHQNIILRDQGELVVSPLNPQGKSPEDVWSLLDLGQALAIPHHTSHTRMSWQWSHFNDDFVRLVEVFQAARGNYEMQGAYRSATSAKATGHFVRDGLNQGKRFGFIASTDHGNGAAYAAVLAPGPSREELFDAMHARRTYAATTKGMLVDFRIDDHWMGEDVTLTDPPTLFLDVRGTQELAEVQVFRNGRTIFGRGHTVRRDRPDEVVFELRFWNKGPLASLEFEITFDRGQLELVKESQQDRDLVAFSEDRRTVRGVGLEEGGGSTIVRRFRYVGDRNARLDLTIAGTHYRNRGLREILRMPITQAGLYQFAVKDSLTEKVDLKTGLGDTALQHTWVDQRCPDQAWYYARVIQTDGEVAWSSPIFVRRE